MAGAVAYAVPKRGLDAWMERLAEQAVDFDTPGARFGEPMIAVRDPDNLPIELIETPPATPGNGGATDGVPADDGSHSVTSWLRDPEPTARPLTELSDHGRAGEEPDGNGRRHRLAAPGRGRGSMIDLLRSEAPNIGRQGVTTSSIIRHRITSPAYNPQPGT
jgi:glyoxalase family protein